MSSKCILIYVVLLWKKLSCHQIVAQRLCLCVCASWLSKCFNFIKFQLSSVAQSCLTDSATPWTADNEASLSITISQSSLKLMSIESVMPTISSSFVPFSSCLQSFPASGSFQMSHLFASGGQSIGVSAWASVLPMNIQDWYPLWWTGLITLQSKGLSRVFSNTIVQKHQFFGTRLSL